VNQPRPAHQEGWLGLGFHFLIGENGTLLKLNIALYIYINKDENPSTKNTRHV
jgi:hypothetical protein